MKKKRKTYREDGTDGGWDEYWDYVFPEDQSVESSLKLLQMARKWKEQQQDEDDGGSQPSSRGEENEQIANNDN